MNTKSKSKLPQKRLSLYQTLQKRALKHWDKQICQRAFIAGDNIFPIRFSVKISHPTQVETKFDVMREQILELTSKAKDYDVSFETIRTKRLGTQKFPVTVEFKTIDSFCKFIKKSEEFANFCRNVDNTVSQLPELREWLIDHTNKIFKNDQKWAQLITVCVYFKKHPQPNLYLRQLDIPHIESKFIENNKQILAELLDIVIPTHLIRQEIQQLSHHGFERRYHCLYDEKLVRFRLLDRKLTESNYHVSDISLPISQFKYNPITCHNVIITENKINGLCFPKLENSIIIFGMGYGIQALADIEWLAGKNIYYWGDIDTHGFAILSRIRKHFPQIKSMLMDQETLLTHKALWGQEALHKRCNLELEHLTPPEIILYHNLRDNLFGCAIRLEQERIPFQFVTSRCALL